MPADLLRAVAGMPFRDQKALNPVVNTIQTLVAVQRDDGWRIALLQNTSTQFYGRADLSQARTELFLSE